MKNIHIIPTDKPSRLLYFGTSNELTLQVNPATFRVFERSTQNIFITSDEEIKIGDWVLNIEENTIFKPSNDEIYDIKNSEAKYYEYCKKIILTDNQELIKDDVQAIDDDFLEWFVQNPSCEEVGVSTYHVKGDISGKLHYKIIIPKEEPQERLRKVLGTKHPKQETLEEAAERLVPEAGCELNNSEASYWQQGWIKGCVEGSKWQQERSYSEEEVKDMLFEALNHKKEECCVTHTTDVIVRKVIEQFKKK
jgi:hypothetical protein